MSRRNRVARLASVIAAVATGSGVGAQEPTTPFAAAARRLVAEQGAVAPRSQERTALRQLYENPAVEPLWSTGGRPTLQSQQAIALLAASDAKGLEPADYDVPALRRVSAGLVAGGTDPALFDVLLSRSLIRLLTDLHMGRVDPQGLGFDLPSDHATVDAAAFVARASRAPDVAAVVAGVEPPYAGYLALERSLARYRVLATDTTLKAPARSRTVVHLGDRYAEADALRRLLVALGDMDSVPRATPVPNDSSAAVYDATLAAGVAGFQARHGLAVDSVLGPATMAELRVPLAQRVRQMALTLERWRWLPHRPPARYLVVNIPSFRLAVFEDDSTARCPALALNVIVGQAEGRHGTPVFTGVMREVVFRPYWDVPLRIARNELLPIIRRDPAYLERERLEIVRGGETDAVVYPPTSANLSRVAAGTLRLRQRPGPGNALGFVKFVFPNPYNVFLHGTPAQELFARARRDFSHGCIRVEDPTALAELVLRGQPGWDRPAIEAAMQGSRTLHVPLQRTVAVYVLYATVEVDGSGTVRFYPDLYGHDRRLQAALGAARGSS